PTGGVTGTNVRPLAQVGLAENDSASLTQLRRDERIALRLGSAYQRQRPRSRHHLIGSVDVVLDQQRDPMKGSTHALLFALPVEGFRDLDGIRVKFDYAIDGRPAFINGFDAAQILFSNRASGVFPRLHTFLQVVNGNFVEFKGRDVG